MNFTTTLTAKINLGLALIIISFVIYDMITGNINTLTIIGSFYSGVNLTIFLAEYFGGAGSHNHPKYHSVEEKK